MSNVEIPYGYEFGDLSNPSQLTYQIPFFTVYMQMGTTYGQTWNETTFTSALQSFASANTESFDTSNAAHYLDPTQQQNWITYVTDLLESSGADLNNSFYLSSDQMTLQTYLQMNFLRVANNAITAQLEAATEKASSLTDVTTDLASLVTFINKKGQDGIEVIDDGKISGELVVESDVTKQDYDSMREIYTRLKSARDLLTDSDSLYETLGDVLSDLQEYAEHADTVTSSAYVTWKEEWALDSDGTFGANVRKASIAATNYNAIVAAELKKQMFVFEEFYKGAGTMLDAIGSLLERTAKAIG